jgi:hypothetical protein
MRGSGHPQRLPTVRVRAGNKGTLTVKGVSVGATRKEYEYVIPVTDADKMINQLCEKPIIEKNRYKIPFGGFTWEVDESSASTRASSWRKSSCSPKINPSSSPTGSARKSPATRNISTPIWSRDPFRRGEQRGYYRGPRWL